MTDIIYVTDTSVTEINSEQFVYFFKWSFRIRRLFTVMFLVGVKQQSTDKNKM